MSNADFPTFRPHPLLRNRHAQTIAGVCLPAKYDYRATHRVFALDDGDQIVLHDDCPPDWKPGNRVVLLVHGMCGSHMSGYMARTAAKLNARGVRTFRKDLRGFGAGADLARSFCHAGRSEDVASTFHHVAKLCPQSPITIAGFSLGGNLTLKYLGELGDNHPDSLDSAIAVAPPIDLTSCAASFLKGFNRFYDWSFMRNIHQALHHRRRTAPELIDQNMWPLPRQLREFDKAYTAPINGFKSAEEYYACSSSARHLSKIKVPTLIVAAADDPLIPVAMFERHSLSSAISLRVTDHGGHLGFIGVSGVDPDRRWLDWRIVDWIAKLDQEAVEKKRATLHMNSTGRSPSMLSSMAR